MEATREWIAGTSTSTRGSGMRTSRAVRALRNGSTYSAASAAAPGTSSCDGYSRSGAARAGHAHEEADPGPLLRAVSARGVGATVPAVQPVVSDGLGLWCCILGWGERSDERVTLAESTERFLFYCLQQREQRQPFKATLGTR